MNRKLVQYNYQLKKNNQKRCTFFIIYSILLIILINILISFVIFPVRQNSSSMNPDIANNSLVMVSPVLKNYGRGDIILVKPRADEESGVFKTCLNKLVLFFTGQQISLLENEDLPGTKPQLRRIIGLPGDSIYMRDYVMYIKPQNEKHYLTEFEITPKNYNVTFFTAPAGWDSQIGVKGSFDEIKLNENEYFVLGDTRKSTDDSRLWGVLSRENIEAKALCCYFPFKKFKMF
ncbi:MAG: signal peptidase I [Clostridia bacterium]|nr:signal peptidase I [Clostridia bacterium]